MGLSAPHTPELEDQDAELVRLEHERKLVELQKLPASSLRVIRSVELADGVPTPIAHGLGRALVWVRESCVRGAVTAGLIVETRDGTHALSKFVTLTATGWGATITVDVLVL